MTDTRSETSPTTVLLVKPDRRNLMGAEADAVVTVGGKRPDRDALAPMLEITAMDGGK
jgi:hypothetical protein